MRAVDPHALTDLQVRFIARLLEIAERHCDLHGVSRGPNEQEIIEAFKRERDRLERK